MVSALVFLAPGFEEIETATVVDILRRCGIKVALAGLSSEYVEGAHQITFKPDVFIENTTINDFDAVICPGGNPGYKNLKENTLVLELIKNSFKKDKLIGAICGGPVVLSEAGILKNKNCTIYPGMESELVKGGGKPQKDLVVQDGNIITSQGPATALLFAFAIANKLVDNSIVEDVKKKTLSTIVLKL